MQIYKFYIAQSLLAIKNLVIGFVRNKNMPTTFCKKIKRAEVSITFSPPCIASTKYIASGKSSCKEENKFLMNKQATTCSQKKGETWFN